MKLYQSLALMGLALFGLASCSEEPDFKSYESVLDPKVEQVAFEQTALTFRYTPADEIADTVPFVLRRSNAAQAMSMKVELDSSDPSILSCSIEEDSTVVFKEGCLTDTVWVYFDKNKYAIGKEYTLDITLVEDSGRVEASATSELSATVSFFVDYNWVSAGSCLLTTDWAEEGTPAVRVPIQKAAEADGLYRLVDWLAYVEPDYAAKGYHLQFVLDDDYNLLGLAGGMQYVGEDDGTDDIWAYYSTAYPQYCTVATDGNEYEFSCLFGTGNSLRWIVSVQFTWDQGWPGE